MRDTFPGCRRERGIFRNAEWLRAAEASRRGMTLRLHEKPKVMVTDNRTGDLLMGYRGRQRGDLCEYINIQQEKLCRPFFFIK